MSDPSSPAKAFTDGFSISPSLQPALDSAHIPPRVSNFDRRTILLCGLALIIAILAALIAQVLVHLIGFMTNIAYFGRFSFETVSPAGHSLGLWAIGVPVLGGIGVGLMARFGSKAIRGHGIPEAMEQVLTNESRIPPRMTFLKPLSAAVAIGTGGPFGAEGPIIATGGALGSLIGQVLHTTAMERKTLLACGAAAGMSATFGSPVSAVLLAIELLLFEYRARSLAPVALAASAAAGVRILFEGTGPVFPIPELATVSGASIAAYIVLGVLIGVVSIFVTRAVYAIEDAFEHLPIHWMWWPTIGAVVIGIVGVVEPKTLGVGYTNITDIVSNKLTLQAVIILCALKFVSWSIALGSGTSGGTLAPLFTIGAGLGAVFGALGAALVPQASIDLRIAALVGMAAMFAGASRAVLASAVFAFETTLQPLGLLPLLGGCTASYLVSSIFMRNSIMTEKISRRGVRVPLEYSADLLDQIMVSDVATTRLISVNANDRIETVRQWLRVQAAETTHQGYPVLNEKGTLVGVVTRRDLLDASLDPSKTVLEVVRRPPVIVYSDCTLRDATDHMVNHGVGRLPVIRRNSGGALVGILSRSDILSSYRRRIREDGHATTTLCMSALFGRTDSNR